MYKEWRTNGSQQLNHMVSLSLFALSHNRTMRDWDRARWVMAFLHVHIMLMLVDTPALCRWPQANVQVSGSSRGLKFLWNTIPVSCWISWTKAGWTQCWVHYGIQGHVELTVECSQYVEHYGMFVSVSGGYLLRLVDLKTSEQVQTNPVRN